ncbi:metalloregulator ArsR/SmtB family transcription factor [Motilimonas eburnea]|uniref:metalloregulator ArsR/SmtB family transcription factor n=1 Tax=Motilimonas eburnea TaxID=1737488 RepID=UPI001E5E1123|nr:metalloregulator ArsR/SmtB family transcription factor [Motilimonas eburnea]MCE2572894.1 metalloregulator ArsR/SmtB family transcription factor [Motilimonas eburnea]
MLEHEQFKLLADETRLCSLLLLAQYGPLCVCEFTHVLALSQPKISRHLALLRQTGVVTTERQGQWVYYQLSLALPGWLIQLLQQLNQQNVLAERYGVAPEKLQQLAQQTNCCAPQ